MINYQIYKYLKIVYDIILGDNIWIIKLYTYNNIRQSNIKLFNRWSHSSVGQSEWLLTTRSQVQILLGPFKLGGAGGACLAHNQKDGGSKPPPTNQPIQLSLVERKTFNLVVVGSSPTVGIIIGQYIRYLYTKPYNIKIQQYARVV